MRARTKRNAALSTIRDELTQVLDALPPTRQVEVLDFARFLQRRMSEATPGQTPQPSELRLRAVSPETLLRLTGLVHLGGDAIADTDALYDNTDSH